MWNYSWIWKFVPGIWDNYSVSLGVKRIQRYHKICTNWIKKITKNSTNLNLFLFSVFCQDCYLWVNPLCNCYSQLVSPIPDPIFHSSVNVRSINILYFACEICCIHTFCNPAIVTCHLPMPLWSNLFLLQTHCFWSYFPSWWWVTASHMTTIKITWQALEVEAVMDGGGGCMHSIQSADSMKDVSFF